MPTRDDANVKHTFKYDTRDCPPDAELRRYRKEVLPHEREALVEYHLSFCEQCNAFVTSSEESDVPETVSMPAKLRETINAAALKIWNERQLHNPARYESGSTPEQILSRESQDRKLESTKWLSRLERALNAVVEFGRPYTSGTLIGPLRVSPGEPVLGVRGGPQESGEVLVIEVPVKNNVYGIALSSQEDGFVLDVAGFKTTDLLPVFIVINSMQGNLLSSAETDIYGNANLAVPDYMLQDGQIIVTLSQGEEIYEAFALDFRTRTSTSA